MCVSSEVFWGRGAGDGKRVQSVESFRAAAAVSRTVERGTSEQARPAVPTARLVCLRKYRQAAKLLEAYTPGASPLGACCPRPSCLSFALACCSPSFSRLSKLSCVSVEACCGYRSSRGAAPLNPGRTSELRSEARLFASAAQNYGAGIISFTDLHGVLPRGVLLLRL